MIKVLFFENDMERGEFFKKYRDDKFTFKGREGSILSFSSENMDIFFDEGDFDEGDLENRSVDVMDASVACIGEDFYYIYRDLPDKNVNIYALVEVICGGGE